MTWEVGGTGGLVEQVSLSEDEGLSHACVLGAGVLPAEGRVPIQTLNKRVPRSCVCGGQPGVKGLGLALGTWAFPLGSWSSTWGAL